MSRITIEQITEVLEKENWKLLSEKYTNLEQELQFLCPEGHKVFNSWKKMRTQLICPVCKQNKLKDTQNTIFPKKKGEERTLALDQASHITGWAVFDGNELIKYGIFQADESLNEADRLHEINVWFMSMLNNWKPDIVGIEGIQYQEKSGVTTFQLLARLQGILMETCIQANIPHKICPTNTWRAHCGVKGKTRSDKKRSMQLIVKDLFDISVTDDCADAIGIGKFVSEKHTKETKVVSWE